MSVPSVLARNLAVPAIAAPMFLVSGPDLVVETCRAGVIGTFPALNARATADLSAWLDEIGGRLGDHAAAYGVNLIVHRTNPRLAADLAVVAEKKVPLVITSLGAVHEIVDAVHAYGGLVFHDVINLRHAAKAAAAGVDGLIAVCGGAGGHAGVLNPFAFLAELRAIFSGTLVLSGSLSTGRQIAAARLMGADLAYLGTRFIATAESMAPDRYKAMILDARAADIVYTPSISGVHANFLRQSLERAGLDPENLPPKPDMSVGHSEKRAWKDIWSAGHGVGTITDLPTAAELCRNLAADFAASRLEPV